MHQVNIMTSQLSRQRRRIYLIWLGNSVSLAQALMHGKTVERTFIIHLTHCSQYANEMDSAIRLTSVGAGQYLISLGGRRKEQSAKLNFTEYSFHSDVSRISTGFEIDSNVGEGPVLSLSSFTLAWGSRNFCWWNSWSINAGQQILFANLCIRPFSHKNCKLLTLPKLDQRSRTQERQIMQQYMATNFQQHTKFCQNSDIKLKVRPISMHLSHKKVQPNV